MKKFLLSAFLAPWLQGFCAEVAFFYALEQDFDGFRREAGTPLRTQRVGTRSVATFSIGSHRVHAVRMGAGNVETAASAQALLANRRVDVAISVGPVGALRNGIEPGDWGAVAEVVAYQRGTQSASGFALSPRARWGRESFSARGREHFVPEPVRQSWRVASGDVFVACGNMRQELAKRWEADVVDMNLCGLLSVCADHGVGLTAWRVVSDKADDDASQDFEDFLKSYDGVGGKWVADWVRSLPADPADARSYESLRGLMGE
jgi:adenosylhomocysteine nucleosidase